MGVEARLRRREAELGASAVVGILCFDSPFTASHRLLRGGGTPIPGWKRGHILRYAPTP